MRKRKVINAKYISPKWPVGGIVITYLLYKQLTLTSLEKGVYLALAATWWLVVITVMIVSIFTIEPSEPVFREKGRKESEL